MLDDCQHFELLSVGDYIDGKGSCYMLDQAKRNTNCNIVLEA